jgi:hypothetical protein
VQYRKGALAERLVGPSCAVVAEHRRRCTSRTGEQTRPLTFVGELRFEQLADDTEGEVPLELAAARGAHAQLTLCTKRLRLGEEPRLADSRRTLDQNEACPSVRRSVDRRREPLELPLTLEQASRARVRPRPTLAYAHAAMVGRRRIALLEIGREI